MTSNYTHMNSIDELLSEIKHLLSEMYPTSSFEMFEKAFSDIIDLFDGKYDGYMACNTPFHNLQHTLDCLLAMSRLLHGAWVDGVEFIPKEVELGLVAALMHDTGYIQEVGDPERSGAVYTLTHVGRSIAFLQLYFEKNTCSDAERDFCLSCINYTGYGSEIEEIESKDTVQNVIGQMLGTADIVGQMADQSYLEKLPYLAEEFRQGGVPGYEGEYELLKNTKQFYLTSRGLLKNEYGGVVKYLKSHFEHRWNINSNVYLDSIQKQINYLEHILNKYPDGYQKHLKRKGFSKTLGSEKAT